MRHVSRSVGINPLADIFDVDKHVHCYILRACCLDLGVLNVHVRRSKQPTGIHPWSVSTTVL